MKHPNVIKIGIWGAYAAAVAIGWHNVELSAIGLAAGGDIAPVDWSLAVGMMMFEGCLSVALGTPSFWPVLLASADSAINGILDASEGRMKYQIAALALLVIFVAALSFFTWKTYELDLATTRAAVYPPEGEPTKGQVSKVYGLVFGPEALLVGAGLAGLAGGVSRVQFNQISKRSEQLAAHYETGLYGADYGPNLND